MRHVLGRRAEHQQLGLGLRSSGQAASISMRHASLAHQLLGAAQYW